MISVGEFLSMTLDPIRLALLGAAAAGPVDVAIVANDLGVDEHKVLKEYGKLTGAGLIGPDRRLDVELLRALARSVPTDPPIDQIVDGPWTDEEARILARFFSGRRLTSVPSTRSKRLLVLELLALEFEPGRRYQEREVDFALQLFFADYVTLRRYLIDEGFMTRADGVYWRTGGRISGPAEPA